MDALKHPAEEAAERLEAGDDFNMNSLTRAEVKFVIHALTGGDVWDDETIRSDVFDNDQSATVTHTELIALAEYLAGDSEGDA